MMTGPTDTDGGGTGSSFGPTDDPAYFEAVGRAIRVLRTERGMERKDLAEASGLSYPYLSEMETGKKRASSKALFAIAEALGVRPADLLALGDRYAERLPTSQGITVSAPSVPPPAAPAAPPSPAPAPAAGGPSPGSSVPPRAMRREVSTSAPRSPAPSRTGRWRWFEREERDEPQPLRAASADPLPAPADASIPMAEPRIAADVGPVTPPDEERRALLEGLAAAAEALSDEDLAALIDLARRLGR